MINPRQPLPQFESWQALDQSLPIGFQVVFELRQETVLHVAQIGETDVRRQVARGEGTSSRGT